MSYKLRNKVNHRGHGGKSDELRNIKTILFITLLLFVLPATINAENMDPGNDGSQYAWGENVGFINLEPGGDGGSGVTVGASALTGYAWGENAGWISLSCSNDSSCGTNNYKVENVSGDLRGYAWGENAGWIKFNPAGGGVWIASNGNFKGYAWGENIGWINFNGVKTSWTGSPIHDDDNDGYRAGAGAGLDCDDNDAAVYPNAAEVCDGKDNDCDDSTDEGVLNTYYSDADSDNYGDADSTTEACAPPSGHVTDNTDCNDDDNAVNPGAAEICNLVNDDCDQETDEGCLTLTVTKTGAGTGTVTSEPSGINCGTDCTGPYEPDTVIALTATADTGSVFMGWSGGGCSGTGTCSVTMDAGKTVTALYNYAENIDDGSKYAWGENVGFINLEPGGNNGLGVTVGASELTGYMWGENVGWISLSCSNDDSCGTNDYKVENVSGDLRGYAWGENAGWIKFNPAGGGVWIDSNGNFKGYAWGENIGWINFNGVKTSWHSSLTDNDNDGHNSGVDNCPETSNPGQEDSETPDGMISYWKFDEGSGTSADDSAGHNNGTLTNGPVWTAGIAGGALSFDGVNDYVAVTSPANLPSGDAPRSITAWIKDDDTGDNWGSIIQYGQGDCPMKMFGLGKQGGKLTHWGGCKDFISSLTVPQGQWAFIAAIYNGNTVTLWVTDQSASTSVNGYITPAGNLFIGAETVDNGVSFRSFFKGLVDEVAVYNRALTAAEIQRYYQNGLNGHGYEEGDGVGNACDNCPYTINEDQADTDSDGIGDICDTCSDADGDGFGDSRYDLSGCAGSTSVPDTNDNDNTVYPGAPELCDGKDNDNDGQTDEGFDTDGDGFTTCGGDCDDNEPAVNPGAAEVCDSLDNDCDAYINEGFTDTDSDGVADCVDSDDDADGVSDASDVCPLAKPAKAGGAYYNSLQEAYNGAADGGTVQSQYVTYSGDLNFNLNKTVTINGGYNCNYTSVSGTTTVTGTVTVSNGKVTIEYLKVQQ